MSLQSIVKFISTLFDFDIYRLLVKLFNVTRRLWFTQNGLYEVLTHEVTLELNTLNGSKATYDKHQQVKFLQDNTIAYQDQAFGDGEIFTNYKCSPGEPVDFYQDGNRWRVLISLRESKSRGQIEDFHIERQIKNGFTKPNEYFQTRIDHKTRRLTMSVVFQEKRYPKRLILVEENRKRTTELSQDHTHILPDNRLKVTWSTDKPRLYEAYTLRWSW